LRKAFALPECGGQLDIKPDGRFYATCRSCREQKNQYLSLWRQENPEYNHRYWQEYKRRTKEGK